MKIIEIKESETAAETNTSFTLTQSQTKTKQHENLLNFSMTIHIPRIKFLLARALMALHMALLYMSKHMHDPSNGFVLFLATLKQNIHERSYCNDTHSFFNRLAFGMPVHASIETQLLP